MNDDKKNKSATGNIPATQTVKEEGMPIKNTVTDKTKNAAAETPGLNQEKTTRDDIFPSDGDNLTN